MNVRFSVTDTRIEAHCPGPHTIDGESLQMVQIEKRQVSDDASDSAHTRGQPANAQHHLQRQSGYANASEHARVTAALAFMINTDTRPSIKMHALAGDTAMHYHLRTVARRVFIHDARPLVDHLALSLDHERLQSRRHVAEVDDRYDDTRIRRDYYPEIDALVRVATGAARVVFFDHAWRRSTLHASRHTPHLPTRMHRQTADHAKASKCARSRCPNRWPQRDCAPAGRLT